MQLLRIEPAAPADITAIRELLAAADLPTADVREDLMPAFVVLRDNEAVRGAAACEPLGRCALLRSVVVAAGLQSQGHGARLIAAAQQAATARGLYPIYLLTTTAGEYFERLGFRPLERQALPAEVQASREFTTLCPDSAVAMVRT